MKIPVRPTSRQTIWHQVRRIRRVLGVENDLYFDVVHFIENVMPEIFPEFVFEISTQKEMGALHGETIPIEHKIRIREDVYIGACNGNGRDRFTLAHEIGHFFMHDERSIVFCKLKPNGEISKHYDAEWQADVFGGELLAPSYLIDGKEAEEVRKLCTVSLPCAQSQLGAIQNERKKGFNIVRV